MNPVYIRFIDVMFDLWVVDPENKTSSDSFYEYPICTFIVSLHVAVWLKPSGLRYVNVPSLRVLEKDMMNELTGGSPLSLISSWPIHSLLRWASDPYSACSPASMHVHSYSMLCAFMQHAHRHVCASMQTNSTSETLDNRTRWCFRICGMFVNQRPVES